MAKLAGSVLLSVLFATACKKTDDFKVPPGSLVDAAIDARRPDAHPDAIMLDAFQPDGAPDAFFDHTPPTVVVTAPVNNLIYAGVIDFTATVTDAEIVTSVTATIGGTHSITLSPSVMTPGDWKGSFDSTLIAGVVAPNVTVRATNVEGLMTTVSFLIALDNQPPVADMDPPKVRFSKLDAMTMATDCSEPIDPVSPDAPNDLSIVAQLIEFRARVADLPNSGTLTSTLFIPKAGVSTVSLWVLDDSTRPLVVDTNGDGFCDSINPLIVPATTPNLPNEAALVTLGAVAPSGVAVYKALPTFAGSNAATCSSVMMSTTFAPICGGEPQQSVIIHERLNGLPQIYGIPPIDANNCMGFAFDARAANIADGWACVAVLATDALGNHSVSPPLRVCIDSDQNGDCASGSFGAPPNCTGTYNVSTAMVSNTPCTFRPATSQFPQRFQNSGVLNDYELIPE